MYVGVALYWVASSFDEPESAACVKPLTAGLKCRSQVTGQVTGHRPGLRSDHRSGLRSDHSWSHTKTIGHWTNLFLIDILLYKVKQAKELQLYFFCSELYQIPHMRKYIHCWSRKEDLRYSVTKVGNEITKVRKITCFLRKKRISKRRAVALRISWRVCGCFEKHSTGKRKKNLRTV